jgi:hypothetical protein
MLNKNGGFVNTFAPVAVIFIQFNFVKKPIERYQAFFKTGMRLSAQA